MESCLYRGRVRHRRLRPVRRELSYLLYMSYLDLDELPSLFDGRLLWSARRAAPLRFRREDHLGDPDVPLAEAVRRLVEERTGRRPEGPIRLLTHLRHFGYVFNPISLHYCFARDGARLDAVVADVSNTPWKERHAYVLDLRGQHAPRYAAAHDKAFHVSPFMALDQRYAWRLTLPGRGLSVHIDSHERGEKIFDATLTLDRVEMTAPAMAWTAARFPLMTAKVVAAIHWEALKLWLARVPVVPHPGATRESGGPGGGAAP